MILFRSLSYLINYYYYSDYLNTLYFDICNTSTLIQFCIILNFRAGNACLKSITHIYWHFTLGQATPASSNHKKCLTKILHLNNSD